jgi:dipeptidyl aminopeptidase/acylaminoacyl peptidase
MKRISTIVVLVLISLSTFAQDKFTSQDLFEIKSVGSAVISPDGKYVAYSLYVPRPFTDKPGGNYPQLHVLNRATGESTKIYAKKQSYSSVKWTPDGKNVSFLLGAGKDKLRQVHTIPMGGGELTKVTKSSNSIYSYDWHPSGNSLIYIAKSKSSANKELIAAGFNAEVVEENIEHKNLYLHNIADGKRTRISKGMTVHAAAWNPAGTNIAVQATKKNLVDDFYMYKDIYLIDPNTKETTLLVNAAGKLGAMSWHPNGTHIAFIAGVNINDPVAGSLFITEVPSTKKWAELKNYTPDFRGSVTSLAWMDKNNVMFSADMGVETGISRVKIKDPTIREILPPGKVVLSSFTYAKAQFAFSASTPLHPPELFTMSFKSPVPERKTTSNNWLAKKKLGKQEGITYKSRDGLDIEAVLVYPADYKEGQKYPLINYIHGGPEACVKNGWSTYYSMWGQVAASRGYFVIMPNYRGSSGRGVKFSRMDQKDMGDEEFNDVLDGIQYLVDKGMVDQKRVGIGGGSYGGYFSAWGATKHTEHFAASCMFVGISDQISKRYTTDIPYESYYSHWNVWVHEDYELMLDRSPIKYITQSKTPTLILHGKNDPRVHPSQSLELFRGLKLHGKAPVRLVWYPGEGHGNRKRPAQLDYNIRTMAWFDYYLKGKNDKSKMPPADLKYGVKWQKEEKKETSSTKSKKKSKKKKSSKKTAPKS